MTAAEIVERVNAGEVIRIPSNMAQAFMLDCDRYKIRCSVYMVVESGVCTISKEKGAVSE